MARNSTGTYSLPASVYPPTNGATITTSFATTLFPDIEAEITDSLSRSGEGGMLAALDMSSVSNPSSSTAVAKKIYPASAAVAWANVSTDGVGNVTLNGGLNVSAVAVAAAHVDITLAAGLADYTSKDYAIMVLDMGASGGGAVTAWRGIMTSNTNLRVSGQTGVVTPAAVAYDFSVVLFGAQ